MPNYFLLLLYNFNTPTYADRTTEIRFIQNARTYRTHISFGKNKQTKLWRQD